MVQGFSGKKILLALTGGIAAYKAAELCRELKKSTADVRVVMTHGACEFITPLTMQALSGSEVHTQLLNPEAEAGMGHIQLAKWPDFILVAPASANFIAKYHAGIADDLLTTLLLATEAPVFLAPAMNQAMWRHPLTQKNITDLCHLMGTKLQIIGPDVGEQACGDVGPGRLLAPEQIIAALASYFEKKEHLETNQSDQPDPLAGRNIIITAGPTREAIDPVRYISNHSSGKMGYALAQACQQLGASVTLVSGPCNLKAGAEIKVINVQTALEMHAAVNDLLDRGCDIFIGCAAVADYRPLTIADKKIKKIESDSNHLTITLEQNPDILASVAAREDKPYTVGFAAETHDVVSYARDKLKRKKLDLIVANDVSKAGQGFNSELNEVCLITHDEELVLQLNQKTKLAAEIAEFIAKQIQSN